MSVLTKSQFYRCSKANDTGQSLRSKAPKVISEDLNVWTRNKQEEKKISQHAFFKCIKKGFFFQNKSNNLVFMKYEYM